MKKYLYNFYTKHKFNKKYNKIFKHNTDNIVKDLRSEIIFLKNKIYSKNIKFSL